MPQPVVADWIRYHSENRKPSDPLFAAWTEVDNVVRSDPERGWALTLELIEAAPDDRVLANVAAGPLEDLLSRSPDQFVDRAELCALQDSKFRRCLTGVWGLPPAIQERLAKYTSTVKDPL